MISLPGREEETAEILEWLQDSIKHGKGDNLYISGVPGTGKTVTVLNSIEFLSESHEFDFIHINAMNLSEPNAIYSKLFKTLANYPKAISPKNALTKLDVFFRKNKKLILLLIDELDLLITRSNSILTRIFNSSLILIAIANTMDLPERLPHKISSRIGSTRVIFTAYCHAQLVEICKIDKILSKEAIEFCARKVAGMSGDARRAIDICRRAVQLFKESEDFKTKKEKQLPLKFMRAVIGDLFTPPNVLIMSRFCVHQILFLVALRKTLQKNGQVDAIFQDVFRQHMELIRPYPQLLTTMDSVKSVCEELFRRRFIFLSKAVPIDPLFTRIKLGVNESDVLIGARKNIDVTVRKIAITQNSH